MEKMENMKAEDIKSVKAVVEAIRKDVGDRNVVALGLGWLGTMIVPDMCEVYMELGVPDLMCFVAGKYEGDRDIQARVCHMIGRMAMFGDDEMRAELVKKGCGKTVVRAMNVRYRDGDEWVLVSGCTALYHLARVRGGNLFWDEDPDMERALEKVLGRAEREVGGMEMMSGKDGGKIRIYDREFMERFPCLMCEKHARLKWECVRDYGVGREMCFGVKEVKGEKDVDPRIVECLNEWKRLEKAQAVVNGWDGYMHHQIPDDVWEEIEEAHTKIGERLHEIVGVEMKRCESMYDLEYGAE